ncbi:hypothetical protein ABZX92_27685 [Lentzea sp. NPDC006480]|uniref:hypothetical protein n=1 Tax=Lentzea sp. NPDC006480 TaxID=3157176 RepID=UPI0033B332A5
MSIQLAFGVTAGPGVSCWLPAPGGTAVLADARAGAHPPGSPVAIGPGADPADALRQLALLSDTAAGAGVDLGGGFTSARLAGAQGDRRDAVLAALKLLGTDDRLGDRAANLVAMFGPSATKRVGAAAHAAVSEQRWAALHLASAASDLLGPEQLERVLDLRAPDGTDPFPRGAASTLAEHLSRLLTGYQRPRRLTLIISLWDHVCSLLVEQQRRERRASSQTRAHRIDKLRERHRTHFDEPLLERLGWTVTGTPTLAEAARWRPPDWWTAKELGRLLLDAISATALLRFARTLSDEGLEAAAEQHRDELAAADELLTEDDRSRAARRPEGAYSHPARPGNYVHQVLLALSPERLANPKTENYVRTRTSMARNYGVVVFDAVIELLDELDQPLENCWDACKPWHVPQLHKWRTARGFWRPPQTWDQPPLADKNADAPTLPFAQRLAVDPEADEAPHDLLWLADLADSLAPFHGADRARVRMERPYPLLTYDRPRPQAADSLPLAAAQVAQLVMFGATPPPRCGTWPELTAGVNADAVITEASTGTFPIPAEVLALDKQIVAGLSVELGRDRRQLAEWSGYMGNCIGESWYAAAARKGQCVLIAFRNPSDGRIAANLDIRRHLGGWHVHELQARFNENVTPALEKQIKHWVDSIPMPVISAPEPLLPVPPPRARGGRRSAAGRLPAELTKALSVAVEQELASVAPARRTYARLARSLGRSADFEPEAAVIALKRLDPGEHTDLLRAALISGLDASVVWQATRTRPLAAAVARLDPELRSFDRLGTLTDGSPLPRTLRALVRRPEIAPAHALDVVSRSLRTALGCLIADETLTRSVARSPSPELLCALVIATTCAPQSTTDTVAAAGKTAVPGFPASDLSDEDGPWQNALAAAAELDAPVDLFWERVAEHGLLIPAALLGKGGWPALWSRAHR